MKEQKLINAEVEAQTIKTLLLPMELPYTGQFIMESWKLQNYSLKTEQVCLIIWSPNKHPNLRGDRFWKMQNNEIA